MNKVIMMGRLTRDPEIRSTRDGSQIARYTLAVDRKYHKEDEPKADFFNCTSFGKVAETIGNFLHKGSKVVIDGEVRNNNYTDKNGNKVYGYQIIVNNFDFAESKASEQANSQPQASQNISEDFAMIDNLDDQDMPF